MVILPARSATITPSLMLSKIVCMVRRCVCSSLVVRRNSPSVRTREVTSRNTITPPRLWPARSTSGRPLTRMRTPFGRCSLCTARSTLSVASPLRSARVSGSSSYRHQRDAVRIVQPVSLGAVLDRRVRQIRADDALRAAIEDQVVAIGVAGDHAVVDVGEDRVHETLGAAQVRDRRPQTGLRSVGPGDVTDHDHAAASARLASQRAHSDGRDDALGVLPIAHYHLEVFRLHAAHGAHQGHLVRLQPGYAVDVEQTVRLVPLRLRRGCRAEHPFRTRIGQQNAAGSVGRHYPVFDAVERGRHQVVAPSQPGRRCAAAGDCAGASCARRRPAVRAGPP